MRRGEADVLREPRAKVEFQGEKFKGSVCLTSPCVYHVN